MKIPEHLVSLYDSPSYRHIEEMWKKAAEQLSLESGIFIEVDIRHGSNNAGRSHMTEIVFMVAGHEFAGLADVKRAIANKAFL